MLIAKFMFRDMAGVLLTDTRRVVRTIGRGVSKVIDPGLDAFEAAYNRASKMYQPDGGSRAEPQRAGDRCALSSYWWLLPRSASRLGAELIPSLTQGEFQFEVRLPEGKALQQTDGVMRSMEQQVMAYPEVRSVFSSVGGSNKNQFARESKEENVAQLYVVMKEKQDKAAEARVIDRIRAMLQQFPEVAFTFSRPTLFSVKTPVEVEIYAYDLDTQRKVANDLVASLQRIRGLNDIRTSTELGNPEIQVRFDREKLARMGLDEGTVSNAIRSKVRGDVATRYREDDKQIEILVRADERQRNTIDSIQNLLINVPNANTGAQSATPQPPATPPQAEVGANSRPATSSVPADRPPVPTGVRGVPIRLGAIADVSVGRGPSEVRRIRSQRAAVVSANLSGRDLTGVSDEIRARATAAAGTNPA